MALQPAQPRQPPSPRTRPSRTALPTAGTTFGAPTLYVNPDTFHTLRVLEWSAEVEQPFGRRDVVSFSYSGNHGYDEPLSNNLLNHTNLAVPSGNVGAGGFGLITSTVSSPTSIYGTGQGAIISGRVLVPFAKFIF